MIRQRSFQVLLACALLLVAGSCRMGTGPGPTLRPSFRAVAFGAGKFVAVADDGVIVTSSDGKTWQNQTSGVLSDLKGVTFGGGQFVAAGRDGWILVSTDGVTWKPRYRAAVNLAAATFGKGTFVVAGESLTLLTSTDGVTWRSVYTGSGFWQDVTFTGSAFVAVDRVGGVLVSTDAATWTLSVPGNHAGDTGFCAVTGGPSGAVLALDYTAEVKVSSDATATSFSVQAKFTGDFSAAVSTGCDVINDGDTFVAAIDGVVEASADGKTWTPLADPPIVTGLAADGTHVVGVGPNGKVLDTTCSAGTCAKGTATTVEVPEPAGADGANTGPPQGSSGSGGSSGSSGSSGTGACGDAQHQQAQCPDGKSRCCSVNMICCKDTSNGGAIGCQFKGFCE